VGFAPGAGETIWVLTTVYEREADEIGASVGQLLTHKELILQNREMVASALEIVRSRPALGFTDCLLLEASAVLLSAIGFGPRTSVP
jgi:predicted nucleic-acid-binding protein